MELAGKKINFLGDSITFGVGCSERRKGYCELLKQMAGLAQARNYGVCGSRIARQRIPSGDPDHDRDFCLRYQEMDDDADLVVVFGGTNDYGHGDAAFGTPDDCTPDTFYGALRYLSEGLIKKYPRACLVFLTPLHRIGEREKNAHGLILYDYVMAIRNVACSYSIPVLDLFALSGIQPSLEAHRELYMPDGLHPSDEGNVILANRLYGFLKTL